MPVMREVASGAQCGAAGRHLVTSACCDHRDDADCCGGDDGGDGAVDDVDGPELEAAAAYLAEGSWCAAMSWGVSTPTEVAVAAGERQHRPMWDSSELQLKALSKPDHPTTAGCPALTEEHAGHPEHNLVAVEKRGDGGGDAAAHVVGGSDGRMMGSAGTGSGLPRLRDCQKVDVEGRGDGAAVAEVAEAHQPELHPRDPESHKSRVRRRCVEEARL